MGSGESFFTGVPSGLQLESKSYITVVFIGKPVKGFGGKTRRNSYYNLGVSKVKRRTMRKHHRRTTLPPPEKELNGVTSE